jgi:hypothetical protein
MLKREERQRKAAEWLEHLQGWKASGESLAAYAQRSGLALWAAYHWRRVLMQDGSWQEDPATPRKSRPARKDVRRVPLRFARVTVTDSTRSAPLIVQVQLANGRRAEIELADAGQLGEVLGVLERPA